MNKALKKKSGWKTCISAYLGGGSRAMGRMKKQKADKKKRSDKRKARRNNRR